MSEARVTRAQARKRACSSQPESTRTKRKLRAGKKKAADTVANTSASTNTAGADSYSMTASTNTAASMSETNKC